MRLSGAQWLRSIIDEAEVTLESLSASKRLKSAMKSRDPTELVQAIIQAGSDSCHGRAT